ncbi:hypothetical protein KI387_011622, partial [Taxus chinensis]
MNPAPSRLSVEVEPKKMKKSFNVVVERAAQRRSSHKNEAFTHRKPLVENTPKEVSNFGLYRNGPDNLKALFPTKTGGMQAPTRIELIERELLLSKKLIAHS